jgi:outer membrane protein OmpA-like peptidoglycan-associated protein
MRMAVRAGQEKLPSGQTLPVASSRSASTSALATLSHMPGNLKSSGEPIETGTRAYFESRFGYDFSRVRVHANSDAASSAKLASAQAYTVGRDVIFGTGMYNPRSPAGRRLLAHELVHVVQQSNSSGTMAHAAEYESEANSAKQQMERGAPIAVKWAGPVRMQRQAIPGSAPQTNLAEPASPLLAAAIGSVELDGFETGKADISSGNVIKLSHTIDTMRTLLRQYPASAIRVIGHTDAVGQEDNNQMLGQARADSVRDVLLQFGIPEIVLHTESRGATDRLVQTKKGEPRNRRVEVRFEPSRLLRGAMSQGLTLTPPSNEPTRPGKRDGGLPGPGDLCTKNPTLCYGKGRGGPDGPPTLPEGALQPIPDNTPFNRMDVQGANQPYTDRGQSPNEGGDLRATWAKIYWKYRHMGLSEDLAAKAANAELSGTAGKEQSRDNPNPADRLDQDMQRGYPNATKLGPGNITILRF